jgi:hypothetical protein
VCPPVTPCTKCDLYRVGDKNVWVERGEGPSDASCPGICLLDTMSEDQVIYSLEHDEKAREDLLKVTTDPRLIELAQTIPRLPVVDEADAVQADLGRDTAGAIPFYAVFRGQPPFAQ